MMKTRDAIHPQDEDTWETIAARALPETPLEEAVANLQSWNLHIFGRAPAPPDSPRAGNPILPCDLLFIEPPLAQ